MTMLTYRPKTRLSELVKRLGGIARDDAVEGALQQLESMRAQSDGVIEAAIVALENIAYAVRGKDAYSPEQMQEMLRLGDQIVTLAGTFNYAALDTATRSFCDVTDGLLRAERSDAASIQVHVRSMRMMAPRSPTLPKEVVEKLLSELAKIMTHHGFSKVPDSDDEFEPVSVGAA